MAKKMTVGELRDLLADLNPEGYIYVPNRTSFTDGQFVVHLSTEPDDDGDYWLGVDDADE